MLYTTERSAHVRVPVHRETLKRILSIIPVEADPFFVDDLRDETRELKELIADHWEDGTTCYVGAQCEAYLIVNGEAIDVIVFFTDFELKERILGELQADKSLANPGRF